MKTRLVLTVVVLLAVFACGDSDSGNPTDRSMQLVLDSDWGAFSRDKPGFDGGLAMQILSPGGDYFLSTAMKDATYFSSFRCASTTKTFTGAAVMLLHQEGLLHIDDYLTDYMPGTMIPYIPDIPEYAIPFKTEITIGMLLMHRAGVFDLVNSAIPDHIDAPYGGKHYIDYIKEIDPHHQFTFDELLGVVARHQLFGFPPGERYHYSNTGYSLLGKIIEQVSGQSYSDFIMDTLILPNGLINTFSVADANQTTLPDPFVPGYVYIGNGMIDVTEDNLTANIAEGNMVTTPYDLALWIKKLMTGEAGLTSDTVAMMMQSAEPQAEGSATLYGLGIEYVPSLGWGHNGAHQGYLTDMYYDMENNLAHVTFSNVWDVSDGLPSILAQLLSIRDINKDVRALLP